MVQHYRVMVDDPLRLAAFEGAIRAAVRPGDVVADIGCGLGTFSVFARRAGAARVFAVDDRPVIEAAVEVLRANDCADVVTALVGRSTTLTPPERVDLAIFEDHVAGLFNVRTWETVRDIAARWLKPGGRLLPARARSYLGAVQAAEAWGSLDRFAVSGDRVLGVDLKPTRHRAFASEHPLSLPAAALLGPAREVAQIDLLASEAPRLRARTSIETEREGTIHGLLSWFSLEVGEGWLGTGPLDPPSAWRQLYLPFEKPLAIERGTLVALELDADVLGEQIVWRWRAVAGDEEARGDTLASVPLGLERPRDITVE